jgi:hypothetical protein
VAANDSDGSERSLTEVAIGEHVAFMESFYWIAPPFTRLKTEMRTAGTAGTSLRAIFPG